MDYQAFAAAIVENLPGWRVLPPKESCFGTVLWADITDGTLSIAIDGRPGAAQKGRICLRGVLPTHTRGGQYVTPEGNAPVVTVAADRPAASIAADIERRLLPTFRSVHARQVELLRTWSEHEDLRAAAATALAQYGSRRQFTIGVRHANNSDVYGDIEVQSGSSVRVELSCTPEIAAKIMHMLKTEGHIS